MGCDSTAGSNTMQDESDSRSNSVKPHLDYPENAEKPTNEKRKVEFDNE